MLTREEEREPCRERGERKRRESEGEGGRGERATEMGIAFVPLPSLNPHRAPYCVARAPPAGLSVASLTSSQRRGGVG